jgi:histone-lysine N-methyltransferase SETMAR
MDDSIPPISNWPPQITFENTNLAINQLISLKDFTYITTSIYPNDLYTTTHGCTCSEGTCSIATCSCIQANSMGDVFDPFDDSLSECVPHCSCSGHCNNAPSLNTTLKFPITLRYVPNKGIAAFAGAPIPLGSFVATYAGELLHAEEAAARLKQYDLEKKGHALLVLREVLPSGSAALRTHIDATVKGNVSRFFNHRCGGGNLELITSRSPDSLIPRVCLFANRDICTGEELTFAYGLPNDGKKEVGNQEAAPVQQRCFCGSEMCLGYLPHQEV